MSYQERDGQVILSMSREDYERLRRWLDVTAFIFRSGWFREPVDAFFDRLNSGNPNYTPYQTGESSK